MRAKENRDQRDEMRGWLFTCRVVLASTYEPRFQVEPGRVDAFRGVTVAFAATSNGKIGDGVKVGFQDLRVSKYFVTKCIQSEKAIA